MAMASRTVREVPLTTSLGIPAGTTPRSRKLSSSSCAFLLGGSNDTQQVRALARIADRFRHTRRPSHTRQILAHLRAQPSRRAKGKAEVERARESAPPPHPLSSSMHCLLFMDNPAATLDHGLCMKRWATQRPIGAPVRGSQGSFLSTISRQGQSGLAQTSPPPKNERFIKTQDDCLVIARN